MGLSTRSLLLVLPPCLVSCVALLDFDELQQGPTGGGGAGGADATVVAGSGGTSGGASGAGGASPTGGGAGAPSGGAGGSATPDASAGGGNAPTDGGADAAATGLPLSDLGAALSNAACLALDACAGPVVEIAVLADDCNTLFTRAFEDSYVAAVRQSADAGRTTYDPVLAEACVATLVDAAEQDPPACGAFYTIVEDCKAALGGLSAVGGPCHHDFDCNKGLGCDATSTCPGSCVPLGAVGEPCEASTDCNPFDDLYCQTSTTGPGTCTEYVARGASCTVTGDQCQLGDFCIAQACRPITDVFTTAVGFPCWGGGSLCQPGLSCQFSGLPFISAAECVAELAPLDACSIAVPDACPTGYYCSANALNGGGTCLALPTENQPCASSFLQNVGLVSPCAADLSCVGDICKPKQRLDGACEANAQCYSGLCGGLTDAGPGTCVPPVCE